MKHGKLGVPSYIFAVTGLLAVGMIFVQHLGVTNATPGAIDLGDTAWMLTASSLVLLMTPGLSFFYGGMVDAKNVISVMFQSFLAMGLVSLIWLVCGFSLAFGDSLGGFIGDPRTFFMFKDVSLGSHPTLAPTFPLLLFAMFQLKFAIITPALITGSLAERIKFKAFTLFTLFFTLFIYCPLAHMTWHPQGLLRNFGVLDFAGGTVVHLSAGVLALAGALYVGRRKFAEEEAAPSHLPFVMLGTGMLWFGWFGFNAGSAAGANGTAALAFATTNMASAMAMLTWIVSDVLVGRKPSLLGACIGAVVGLVAVTPAAGFISVADSAVVGAVAALVSHLAVRWKSRSQVDDTLDVFPCHGVGGAVGMLLTAVFAKDGGLVNGSPHLLYVHIAGLVVVVAYCFSVGWGIYWLTDKLVGLRVDAEAEEIGLDRAEHNERLFSASVRF
jgi:Amt family ammonium transporter